MSGVLKSIGKVFKKVVKAVVKWAPVLLAVGAVVFTAGAALGPMAGWAATMGGVTSSLGLSSGMTAILSGAVTQAGFGAAIGMAGAAVTGKDIFKGAQIGALTGAVTGGISGAMAAPASAAASAPGAAASAAPTGTGLLPGAVGSGGVLPAGAMPAAGAFPAGSAAGAAMNASVPGAIAASAAPAAATAATTAATAAAPAAGTGLLGWMNANPVVAGGAIQGIGTGLTAAFGNSDSSLRTVQGERAAITDNYAMSPTGRGLLHAGQTAGDPNSPTPSQRFDPPSYDGEYQYDPQQQKVVFVRTGANG